MVCIIDLFGIRVSAFYLCFPDGEHLVAVLFVRMSYRPSVISYVSPSACSCHGHNSKTLKLLKVSIHFIGRYISLGRSAVHINRNSALPSFRVFFMCSLLHLELRSGHNSDTTIILQNPAD